MPFSFTTSYLEDALTLLRYYKRQGEQAMEQAAEERLLAAPDAESNSIATIVKHMAGNMRSRWTDFPDSDGEKPDRRRDTEFEDPPGTRAAVMELWEAGWERVFGALAPLTEADLGRRTTIRGEAHSVMQAIHRQVAHYACHVGQIIVLARLGRSGPWRSLSIPRGKSAEFTQRVSEGEASQR